ncbi:selenocysteine lyase/cysteine desulfurase [Tamilnaduibacter salinus]|uniref:Aminotransferase n=1 Tax=Tamilnaduibacter salinus TaxID=1484056 RepID=A0A2A2I0J7_9GAMM|nr:aminotransferase class V-fold PLP-dependent enzyme [Tamilnaduibacter salinus]PAV24918.1 aminotransferase [Tamilnaduibacter salinus]PVY78077.1 selenocysteine lyase/cysteine desulfurase [Tamilnaduibacter salinus]
MELEREFPQDPDLAYLNHAAVAPWPERAAERVAAFARENATQGASAYPRWLTVEQSLRRNLAALLNAPSVEDIALVKNTSEALSFVAQGLDWKAGDEIVTTDQEFPSNRIVWEALADRGVAVRTVPMTPAEGAEQRLAEAMTERTRLLAVSSVQYGTGLTLDLYKLGAQCRERGILFCVDAIQSLGAQPLDVQGMAIDFTMADGHKWLLGPEGLGVFYVRPDLRDRLRVIEHGWHMVANRGDFDQKDWTLSPDATRFECGSPNLLAAHALEASTGLLLEVGMSAVQQAIDERIQWLAAELHKRPGVNLITSMAPGRRSGILTFRMDGQDSQRLYRALMDQHVICAGRGGGVRFSPHFYTPWASLELALKRLDELIT